eukprot:227567-Rhodomonas_salina.1
MPGAAKYLLQRICLKTLAVDGCHMKQLSSRKPHASTMDRGTSAFLFGSWQNPHAVWVQLL